MNGNGLMRIHTTIGGLCGRSVADVSFVRAMLLRVFSVYQGQALSEDIEREKRCERGAGSTRNLHA